MVSSLRVLPATRFPPKGEGGWGSGLMPCSQEVQGRVVSWFSWSPTSWPDGVHQSVHLDVPVLDVGAGLSQLLLGRLAGMEERGELVPHCP